MSSLLYLLLDGFPYRKPNVGNRRLAQTIAGDRTKQDVGYTQEPVPGIFCNFYEQYLVLFTMAPRNIIIGLSSRKRWPSTTAALLFVLCTPIPCSQPLRERYFSNVYMYSCKNVDRTSYDYCFSYGVVVSQSTGGWVFRQVQHVCLRKSENYFSRDNYKCRAKLDTMPFRSLHISHGIVSPPRCNWRSCTNKTLEKYIHTRT